MLSQDALCILTDGAPCEVSALVHEAQLHWVMPVKGSRAKMKEVQEYTNIRETLKTELDNMRNLMVKKIEW